MSIACGKLPRILPVFDMQKTPKRAHIRSFRGLFHLPFAFPQYCSFQDTACLESRGTSVLNQLFNKMQSIHLRGVRCASAVRAVRCTLHTANKGASRCKKLFLQATYSNSTVAGGLSEMSYSTRFTPATSLVIRREIFASSSIGNWENFAVMKSSVSTARTATA